MKIRDARLEDAGAVCEVLKRSISEPCVADHRGDPAILARWLSDKTPEIAASWIANPRNSSLLAVDGSTVLGVGSAWALARGNERCTLLSTATGERVVRAMVAAPRSARAVNRRAAGSNTPCDAKWRIAKLLRGRPPWSTPSGPAPPRLAQPGSFGGRAAPS